MTATQTQIRRGTAAQCDAMTPASSEVIHDTTNNRLRAGDGSRQGGWEIPNFTDIQKQVFGYAAAGGTTNALTLTLAPALIAYGAGVSIEFKATANNTGAMTVDVNGRGAVNIKKMKNGTLSAMESGDVKNGGIYRITHDGTQFQIKSLDEAAGGTAGWELLAVASGGGASYDFTSGIDATYKNYALVCRNLIPVNNGVALGVRIRRSGQGSFDATDYAYVHSYASGTAITTTSSNSTSYIAAIKSLANADTTGAFGTLFLGSIGNSGNAHMYGQFSERTSSGGVRSASMAGGNATATAIDGVQLLMSSGNISSGGAYLYGLRSSLS